ncbi:MAG: hypothetical protein ABIH21_00925 [Patescibacteria group bacterium]
MASCGNCGASMSRRDKYCSSCGASAGSSDSDDSDLNTTEWDKSDWASFEKMYGSIDDSEPSGGGYQGIGGGGRGF